ncbi:hypothetical protein E1263_16840 [Kribbella antibiotica]|uniref:Uncharacterized protein n=1 Tax=Kribbella antibiotica TaxID=190195 RepID=A0A4R4ZJX5_9ACTN|nr:hypothetical protein [Kribbella antibiotica]TDD58953.1 hypothetical protein E1263_16840 [Kribbella antibiotica]
MGNRDAARRPRKALTRLRAKGVPATAYSIGVDANESYCLVLEEERRHVYYSDAVAGHSGSVSLQGVRSS